MDKCNVEKVVSTASVIMAIYDRRRRWCLIRCRERWRHDGQRFSRLRDPWSAAVPLLLTDVSIP